MILPKRVTREVLRVGKFADFVFRRGCGTDSPCLPLPTLPRGFTRPCLNRTSTQPHPFMDEIYILCITRPKKAMPFILYWVSGSLQPNYLLRPWGSPFSSQTNPCQPCSPPLSIHSLAKKTNAEPKKHKPSEWIRPGVSCVVSQRAQKKKLRLSELLPLPCLNEIHTAVSTITRTTQAQISHLASNN